MIETLKSYIDKNNFYIIITTNYIYIKNYNEINSMNDNEVILEINNIKYIIKGTKLHLSKYENKELIINGSVESMIKYDQD